MSTIKKIIVPIDFSDAAQAAERRAEELAQALGAELILLHVLDEAPMMLMDGAGYLPETAFAEYEARAKERLGQCAAHARQASVRVRSTFVRGRPEQGIVKAATDEGADLIVMGTHGRRGFRRFMLGSVAERVLRTSKLPVMTVYTPGGEN